ncbi:hypothetical protein BLA29_009853, partial [Euroglyphus maynei]
MVVLSASVIHLECPVRGSSTNWHYIYSRANMVWPLSVTEVVELLPFSYKNC